MAPLVPLADCFLATAAVLPEAVPDELLAPLVPAVDWVLPAAVLPAPAGVGDEDFCLAVADGALAVFAGVADVLAEAAVFLAAPAVDACFFALVAEGVAETAAAALVGDGTGVGDGCWPLAVALVAAARPAVNVASARMRISVISVPFVLCLKINPLISSPALARRVDPAEAALAGRPELRARG